MDAQCRDILPLISAYMDNDLTPDELRAVQGHVAIPEACDVPIVEQNLAAGGLHFPREQLKKCALARTGLPDEERELAAFHVQCHSAQSVYEFAVLDLDALEYDVGVSQSFAPLGSVRLPPTHQISTTVGTTRGRRLVRF